MNPIRAKLESSALMDRGGRPTVRELLAGLEFDPATGALRLNGVRVTLQLAEADRILRRELIRAMGEDEARVFLIRRGFQMGKADAAFVCASWPALDQGDALTAGTRLHTFSGIVRVETLHNDFDFARGRFSADFLWHNSVEADDGRDLPRHAERPACWQQIGYASGYASHFFGALVVYKETACAAQGHKSCRVVGKLAEAWDEGDPEVALFRDRIAPATAPFALLAAPEPTMPADLPEALILGPVMAALTRAAQLPLPCLIVGPHGSGKRHAVAVLARMAGAGGLRHIAAAGTTVEALLPAITPDKKTARRSKPSATVVIADVDMLPIASQATLARMLAESDPRDLPRLVLTSDQPLATLANSGLLPALWFRLAPLAVALPPLSTRSIELPGIAAQLLPHLAARLGLPLPDTDADAFATFCQVPPGGLDGIEAALTTALIETAGGIRLTATLLADCVARLYPTNDVAFEPWLDRALAPGDFSLEVWEARIRDAALARSGGNLAAAARMLGLSRAQLAYRMEHKGK